ncbi:ATP-dependent RNA helicase DeaD [Candidatus Arsenophonus lipoptenae]|uniref:ATP-dependent RNA helicase DeaD n=1 Tax=Candidatus Arsenophonus lipoptenae TaxID=634113 RepID=A0A0X9WB80_9GAMM|nr:DEAD/DEAH box helicase [Candidatus Arsenophonus lipoptenae]AMA65183.1 ATP-dependent RNA helicase DeaD [Candidatus Arsenophonus lipoptenae]
MTNETEISFADLGLSTPIISALNDLGYEKPSPIQKQCIPYLLDGGDLLGIAQTGSGKTAAFSLPLLHNIDMLLKFPQLLILAPTRELAVQVSEAIIEFSKYMSNIKVVALYGGQRYDLQLRALKNGPQIVVGTPGRLLDHLRRGTLNLFYLRGLVIDEADEMLRMGFIEDVENIMNKIPNKHQTALFSATMRTAIRRITYKFMKSPKEVSIKSNIKTRPDITQRYWFVYGMRKHEALVRFLEVEDFDAAIIFVRTKNATLEVSAALESSGYNSSALNGDMNQTLREQTLERLKDGRLDILIATDIAARGLDVERISLVINYDIPMNAESYVHRIGRTGRAGRAGRALLFVDHRERRFLRNIERTIKQSIPEIYLPNSSVLSERRQAKFTENILKQLKIGNLEKYRLLLNKFSNVNGLDIETLASILLKMAQGNRPLILPPDPVNKNKYQISKKNEISPNKVFSKCKKRKRERHTTHGDMQLYRIEVGLNDGVEVRHIVGAIANEADINSRYIGNIELFAYHSTIELLKGIPNEIFNHLTHTRILNKPIRMQLLSKKNLFEHNNSTCYRNYSEFRKRGRRFSNEHEREHFRNRNSEHHNSILRRKINCNI